MSTLRPARCYQHGAAGPWQVVALMTGSKWRSLLRAGDVDETFMTISLNVTPKTTEQHLTVRSDKSVACVTNNKRLRLTFCRPGLLLKLTILTDSNHRAASLRQYFLAEHCYCALEAL